MNRREFFTLLGGAAAAWPIAGRAQQPERMRHIGVLIPYAESDADAQRRLLTFRAGLQKLGWVEGHNAGFDIRWAVGGIERVQLLTTELVNLAPDVILTHSTPSVRSLKRATKTIPIVFVSVSDPVGDGLVASLAKPGGNVTGFSNYDPAMVGKWLQLLKEMAPATARVAVIFNPDTAPHSIFLPALKAAAPLFGIELIASPVHNDAEIEGAIAVLKR